ncbi:hypothetical protein OG552_15205 [Streptomyces sp. NBC_01476]|uniref:hypothetical protein n=1 Tax=Streptomyces sp. NBC_01476 TaxID=2903881 RepID=UPI002E3433DE|nr:hypothetical protein [Streptomyces sp. NBC_01476]
MTPHRQPQQRTLEIDTRLVRIGAVLTAAGLTVACAGMALASSAVFAAGRRMIQRMDVPPSEQAAAKWQQAKEASRAGMQAWQTAADTRTDGRVTPHF